MYNEDLPCELVKERLNSRKNRLTTTTTDLDQTGGDQDSSSDSVLDDMEPPSVLTNVLVMDKIFGYLDVKELKVCRLICKDWNKATSSILSKQNNGNGLAINLQLQILHHDESRDGYLKDDELKRSGEMHSIVEAAPENWFRIVNLEDNHWTRDAFKSVFQDFGNRLKVIQVTSETVHIQTLRSILLDWCPNVEELRVNDINDFGLGRRVVLNISRPLKLTRLSFNDAYDLNYAIPPLRYTAEVLFTIIKNSPNLKKLESFGERTSVPKQIFSKMQNSPHIMNNLEEIHLCNEFLHVMDPEEGALEALSNIQFESKLRKLGLTDIDPRHSIALNRLLNMTNESLEKLILASEQPFFAAVRDEYLQLKQMNRLQEFRYHTDRKGLVNSIDILANMPNLRIFVLGFEYTLLNGNMDDFIDRMFSNCRQLMKIPLQNLKELYLFGYIERPRDTFDVIHRGFPNLKKLVVGINPKNCPTFYTFYYDEVFEGISKLKNLTNLFLHLGSGKYSSDFSNALLKLKDLPKLMHLTMRDAEIDFDEASLMAIPNLRRLTFIGITISVDKVKRLRQLLDERGIFLDIKDRYQFAEGGFELQY